MELATPFGTLHYSAHGDARTTPVICLHGGPGDSSDTFSKLLTSELDAYIILYDQLGCGDSAPVPNLEHNTAENLVLELELLRQHLGIEQFIAVGHSWGAYLALRYASRFPSRVRKLLLVSTWLATLRELDYFLHGAGMFFADYYSQYTASLGFEPELEPDTQRTVSRAFKLLESDTAQRTAFVKTWTNYESHLVGCATCELATDALQDRVRSLQIMFHFFEQICADALCLNVSRLRDTCRNKLLLIHGRFDFASPLKTAYNLMRAVPGAELRLLETGMHALCDPTVHAELVNAIRATLSQAAFNNSAAELAV